MSLTLTLKRFAGSVLATVVFATGACQRGPNTARLRLTLSPASFGETIVLQQRVRVFRADQTTDLDAVLDISPEEVSLIGLAMGQRVLTLRYDGTTLRETRNPLLPRELRGSAILTDLQVALWPAAAVRAGLPPGWSLSDSAGRRVVSRGQRNVMVISYDRVPRWTGVVTMENLYYGYRLVIQSVAADP